MSLLFCNPFLRTDPDPTQETHSSSHNHCPRWALESVYRAGCGGQFPSAAVTQLGQLMRNSSDDGCKLNLATPLMLFSFVQQSISVRSHFLNKSPAYWWPDTQTPFGLTPTGLNSLLACMLLSTQGNTWIQQTLPPTGTDNQAPITLGIPCCYMQTFAITPHEAKYFSNPSLSFHGNHFGVDATSLMALISKPDWPARPFCNTSPYVHPSQWQSKHAWLLHLTQYHHMATWWHRDLRQGFQL